MPLFYHFWEACAKFRSLSDPVNKRAKKKGWKLLGYFWRRLWYAFCLAWYQIMEAEIAYLFFFVVPASVILCIVSHKCWPSRPVPFGFDLRKLLYGIH